jgi:hypothetical protein
MPRSPKRRGKRLKRKSFFVDEIALQRAKKVLGVGSEAEVVRQSVERVLEMGRFWKLMDESRGTLEPGSFDAP